MPVPAGFVIGVSAYDIFVEQDGLNEVISASLKNEDSKDAAASAILEAFVNALIPGEIEEAVLRAYNGLGRKKVAVRSSATAEDLPKAAFAGQQETYLNVIGEEKFLDAVKRVWASLWTARAIAYRERLGIDHKEVKIAVVVQEMVDAEFSGVMFTANPVTGDRGEVVIDAVPGLGEALVSGMASPDHFTLRRAEKGWDVVDKKGEFGLADEHKDALFKLAEIGKRISEHFGAPQDIEWAWENGEIFIVQSRPITALPEEFQTAGQSKFGRLFAGMVAEVMPRRPYPLESLGPEILVNSFLRPFLKSMGISLPAVSELFIEEKGVLVRYSGRLRLRPTPAVVFAPFKIVLSAIRYNPARWESDALVAEAIEKSKTFEAKNYKDIGPDELIGDVSRALEIFPDMFEVRIRYLPRAALCAAGVYIMLFVARKRDIFGKLLYLGIKTQVTEANGAIEELAVKIRADRNLAEIFLKNSKENIMGELEKSETGKTFLAEFNVFLGKWGYRETGGTVLISEPSWREAPEILLGILKSSVSAPGSSASGNTGENWRDIRDKAISRSILKIKPLNKIFISLLDTARYFHVVREDTRFYLMMPISLLRQAALNLGGRFGKAGVFDDARDVFYLKFAEFEGAAKNFPPGGGDIEKIKKLIAERKATYNDLKNTPFVDPRLYHAVVNYGDALVTGTPGSPGMAEGLARVVRGSFEFDELRSGEVLVAPYTNPAWTPLFERACAVVADTGSVMSHAAITAREYGIPAVMATGYGTQKIKNGSKLRVDGTRGKVYAMQN